MLSTASALIEATQNAVMDDETMSIASFITHERKELSQDDFAKAMFMFATTIASTAVDKATKAIMTKEQFSELVNAIDELEQLKNEVLSNGE